MKNVLLILLLLAFMPLMNAQNPHIETFGDRRMETYKYRKGGDSIRFTILGKTDTVQTDVYFFNGKVHKTDWQKDSSYIFDELGKLYVKVFKLKNNLEEQTEVKVFDAQGKLFFRRLFSHTFAYEWRSDSIGRDWLMTSTINKPLISYSRLWDEQGVLINSVRRDTIREGKKKTIFNHDTIYYDSGRPYHISTIAHVNGNFNDRFTESKWYNKDGSLAKSILHDSLRLVVFKDNIDCFYGLKNHHGDTIVKPRFDRIENNDDVFWTAYVGESVLLFNADGSPMPPPSARLSGIWKMNNQQMVQRSFYTLGGDLNQHRNQLLKSYTNYLTFTEGNKYGVMTDEGTVIMPPQYLEIGNNYIGDGLFFKFEVNEKNSFIQTGFLNRQGKSIFSEAYKTVSYSNYKDYFFISLNTYNNGNSLIIDRPHKNPIERYNDDFLKKNDGLKLFKLAATKNVLGLGKAEKGVLIDLEFCYIQQLDKPSLFIASKIKTDNKTQTGVFCDGIYDLHSQRWLLKPNNFIVEHASYNTIVIKDLRNNKYGIMDTLGKYIVPIQYDSIGVANAYEGLFWVKKKDKYQILEIKKGQLNLHTTKYDYLVSITFPVREMSSTITHFIAKQNNKWGIIDANEQVVLPFEYDYTSASNFITGAIMVKNNHVSMFNMESLPYARPSANYNTGSVFLNSHDVIQTKLFEYRLFDNPDCVFFVNDTGKVVIPPQYKLLKTDFKLGYAQVEDAQKKKKIIFFESGEVIDFPFDYKVEALQSKSRVIIVRDSFPYTYGIVSTDGKLIKSCENYAAAIGNTDNSSFFIKQDRPVIPDGDDTLTSRYSTDFDTLNAEDKDWLMYDGAGKLLNNTPFNFPINFTNNIGVGMVGEYFNLYASNGRVFNVQDGSKTEIAARQYSNIRRDATSQTYALYYNQGLKPAMILANKEGEILVENGIYDGISRFYGQYALVSAAGKIGLIDTLGREIIAPQDLRMYKSHFMDSIDLPNKLVRQKSKFSYFESFALIKQPVNFKTERLLLKNDDQQLHPDSLDITPEKRAALWNLLLEKCLPKTIATAGDLAIPRIELRSHTGFFRHYQRDQDEEREAMNGLSYGNSSSAYEGAIPRRINISNNTIAFSLADYMYSREEGVSFYNFYQKNNRWEELKINDLLQIQGEKRWQFNDLITQKVKALKDVQIDCSNASAFIAQIENRFLLTKEGIDFCFDGQGYTTDFVVISFTWAELSPYLKIQIEKK